MSSSSSNSTFFLVLIFVLGTALFLFFRWGGSEDTDEVQESFFEETYEEAERLPNPIEVQRAAEATAERNAFWKELNNENFTAYITPRLHPAHGVSLLLDPHSTKEELRKGIKLLTLSTEPYPNIHAKLGRQLQEAGNDYLARRDLLLEYLQAGEKRILLLKSILGNTIRIVRFAQGRKIPYEGEPWPLELLVEDEPEDEAIYHRNLNLDDEPDLPAGMPYVIDFRESEIQLQPLTIHNDVDKAIQGAHRATETAERAPENAEKTLSHD